MCPVLYNVNVDVYVASVRLTVNNIGGSCHLENEGKECDVTPGGSVNIICEFVAFYCSVLLLDLRL